MLIRKAQPTDICDIELLMNETFGENPQCKETFLKWISDEKFGVFICEEEGQLLALATVAIRDPKPAPHFGAFGEEVQNFLSQETCAMILEIAVKKEYQGKGLGLLLCQEMSAWIESKDIDFVAGTSWQHGEQNTSKIFFEKFGFKMMARSHNFMQTQLDMTGAVCKVCGPVCGCESIFYVKENI
jgi:ribosomal protein S18 acetylase RimI-like enzyme